VTKNLLIIIGIAISLLAILMAGSVLILIFPELSAHIPF